MCVESDGSGYSTRTAVRSSSASGASGVCVVGLLPRNVPGAATNGNMTALQTAECAEAEQVSDFVRENGLEIIGCRVARKGGGSGEGHGRIRWPQQDIGVENLRPQRSEGGLRRVGLTAPIRSAVVILAEGENAGGECRVALVEADRVLSVDGAGVLHRCALQRAPSELAVSALPETLVQLPNDWAIVLAISLSWPVGV